jgi:hypothetical protein
MEKLNLKKVFASIGILIIIAIVIVGCVLYSPKNNEITYSTLISSDESFQISFPSNISYKINQKEDNEFIIDLYSTDYEMFFYATKIAKLRQVDFYQVVNDDKENYLQDKQNIYDDSGIVSSDIPNYTSYEYSFIYSDTSYGKDFYSYVVWIETDNNLYVLNFEVVKENMDLFKDIFSRNKKFFRRIVDFFIVI